MKRKPDYMAYGGRGCEAGRLYSGLERKQALCKHGRKETICFDTVLICVDRGKELEVVR